MSTTNLDALRGVCQLLGGLTLDQAKTELLEALKRDRLPAGLAGACSGDLAQALEAMQAALDSEDVQSLAVEHATLMVANAAGGARRPLPVPPFEDCYAGTERVAQGERSRAALKAYVAAGLGFENMKAYPSDHIGLELCFVAALLDAEARRERDAAARSAFVQEHLAAFAPALGKSMGSAAKTAFWQGTARALTALPAALAS